MKIEKDLLTMNEYSRPHRPLIGVLGLVLHWTGSAGVSARQIRDYFESLKDGESGRYASAHYIVGTDGEVIQAIPEAEMAYHCGSETYTQFALERFSDYPNNCTLAIEMCHPDWDGQFTKETMRSVIELCTKLCRKYGLDPIHDITTHHAVVGWKACPKWFTEHPDDLCLLKALVRDKVIQEKMA